MIHPSQVSTNSITSEMIGRAYKAYDFAAKSNFYQVESSDFANNEVEYKITYSSRFGFQCSCPAGQEGFIHTKNGYCSHVAIAVAASKEEQAAMLQIAREQVARVALCDADNCHNEATHFDSDAIEFRCDCHKAVVAIA